MSVGRKFSKHLIQPPRVAAEETEAQREEGRFLALPTLSVKSQDGTRTPALTPSGLPTDSLDLRAFQTGLRQNKNPRL